MGRPFTLFLCVVCVTNSHAMIMRNNALMTKMVSQFQGKDSNPNQDEEPNERNEEKSIRREGSPEHVLSLMQNVLCKNFPSIPCDIIMKDPTLRKLIERSIQQIKYKKMTMDKPTPPPNYQLTLFPVINDEDLSNFLQVSEIGSYSNNSKKSRRNKQKKSVPTKNYWSHEEISKPRQESKTAVFNGRKKIRKFYPHKIKYKDKNTKRDFGDYSEEKLSMSVEAPETPGVKRRQFSYRAEPSNPAVWRIDYTKHGEPSFNMFGYESDSLQGKIIKTGPNVIVNENVMEQAPRKDVLHPDVYIKKNYVRKNTIDTNSDVID